jgi:hypothetical protein
LTTDTVGSDYFTVNVEPALAAPPAAATAVLFQQATDFASGYVFIPGAIGVDNYLVGAIVYNQTRQEWRRILSFDGTNRLAGLDLSSGTIPTWLLTDTLSIKRDPPVLAGGATTPGLVSGSGNTVVLPATASATFHAYTGGFLSITGITPTLTCRIVDYRNFTCTLDCTLPAPLVGGEAFEILGFSRDSVVPFTYTGSLVSQQEMVCYEIELINLVLPNRELKSGGRIAFYPYVYVELQNVSGASAGTKNVIYSNNPHAKRMLFRAAIDDIPNPDVSPFIKIDGDGMVQTVKFKPNDSFKFGVYLPSGELLHTIDEEHLSPLRPNPLKQISAMFSIRRL